MRLSSEMFPFASCEEHGHKLALFAAETLAEVGKVVAELGLRLRPIHGSILNSVRPSNKSLTAQFVILTTMTKCRLY